MSRSGSRTAGGMTSPWRMAEGSALALVGRILVFLALITVVYWAFRQLTVLLFAPQIAVVRPILPSREISPGSEVQLGVMVVNQKATAGAAFVVAALGDGRQIEGPTVALPAHDTTLVPVAVPLDREDQMLSLVLFDSWRGVRRLQTFSGLRVGVAESDVALEYVAPPDSIRSGEGFALELLARNHNTEPVTVRPRVKLQSGPFQEDRWIAGELMEIAAGDSARFTVTVEGDLLEPGTHFTQAVVETDDGTRRGGTRYPLLLVISN